MSRLKTWCALMVLALAASLAQAHDYEDCCARCKDVAGSCREKGSADCHAKFIGCMEECLQEPLREHEHKGDETSPDKGEVPKSKIPEISDPKKLDELKQQL